MMTRALVFLCLLLLALLAAACSGGGSSSTGGDGDVLNPADVAGAWLGTAVQSDATTSALCLQLEQDGTNVRGSIGSSGATLAGKAIEAAVALVVQSSATADGAVGLLNGAVLKGDLKDDLLTGTWVSTDGKSGTWVVKHTSTFSCR